MTLRPRSALRRASLQRLHHGRDVIGAHRAQPIDAERAQRALDADAGRRAAAIGVARRQILLAGGRGVAVLHHDQHAVAFVEHVRGDAGDQSVVPETAIAHDRDRTLRHVRPDRGGARQRHAVAEDGIAERERREGRERMAADIGADMGRSEFALDQLDRGEDRPLWTAGAEIGRPRRHITERGDGPACARQRIDMRGDRVGIDAGRTGAGEKGRDARAGRLRTYSRRCAAGSPCRGRASCCRRPQDHIDLLLDIIRASPPRRQGQRACRRRTPSPRREPAERRH